MTNATLAILDNATRTTAPGSEDRLEAVAAVAYNAMYRCDDEAVLYIYQAAYGMTDVDFRGELKARMMTLVGECVQYLRDAREAAAE